MARVSVARKVGRLKKVEDFKAQKMAYQGDNVDNVQVRVRLFVANAGQPSEISVELEPDGPEEAAVLAIIEDAMNKKEAKMMADLDEMGFEWTSRGIEVKGNPQKRA